MQMLKEFKILDKRLKPNTKRLNLEDRKTQPETEIKRLKRRIVVPLSIFRANWHPIYYYLNYLSIMLCTLPISSYSTYITDQNEDAKGKT